MAQFFRALGFVPGGQVNVVAEQEQYVGLVAENLAPDVAADLFAVIAAGGECDADNVLLVLGRSTSGLTDISVGNRFADPPCQQVNTSLSVRLRRLHGRTTFSDTAISV
jgi:hypothetical protein